MNTAYIVFWIFVASYFVLKKRDIDLYAVVFFTSSYYSYPLFLGYLYDPENHIYPEIDPRIYLYYSLYFACLVIGAWYRDLCPIRTHTKPNPIPYEWLILSLGLLLIILAAYPGFFAPKDIDNPTRPAALGPIYPLYMWTSFGFFWLALFSKSKALPWVGAFFIVLTAFAGGRSLLGALILAFVVSGAIKATVWQVKKPSNTKYYMFLGVSLVLMILYKVVFQHFLVGDFGAILAALKNMDGIFFWLVEGGEPMLIMMNLQNSLSPVLDGHDEYRQFFLLSWIPVFSNAYESAIGYFNLSFSDVLDEHFYSTVNYGMASTLVGELYYVGSYPLVLFFVLVFNVSLYLANAYMYKSRSWATPTLIWVFYYYHRLELKSLVYVLFVTAVCGGLAFVLRSVLISFQGKAASSTFEGGENRA